MRESREALAMVEGSCPRSDLIAAVDAAEGTPEPLRTSLEAIVELSEEDAGAARQALWRLQAEMPARVAVDTRFSDELEHVLMAGADIFLMPSQYEPTLERLERQVGGQPEQAALRVGAAIHLARAELSSPDPHLRQRLPELLDLLKAEGR